MGMGMGMGMSMAYSSSGGSGSAGVFHQDWTSAELDEESDEDDEQDEADTGGLPHGLYVAAYDFTSESDHELSVSVGEKVRLVGHVDGGWAVVVKILESLSLDEEGQPRAGTKSEKAAEGEHDNGQEGERHGEKGLVPEGYLQWIDH